MNPETEQAMRQAAYEQDLSKDQAIAIDAIQGIKNAIGALQLDIQTTWAEIRKHSEDIEERWQSVMRENQAQDRRLIEFKREYKRLQDENRILRGRRVMRLEPGKYYKHEAGRAIAVVGSVMTWKWGPLLVIEETDDTGHAISCIETGSEDLHGQWTEIGVEEFKREMGVVES